MLQAVAHFTHERLHVEGLLQEVRRAESELVGRAGELLDSFGTVACGVDVKVPALENPRDQNPDCYIVVNDERP